MTSAVSAPTALGRYRRVLRTRQVALLVAAMVVGRLPNGMRPLGIVFLVHQQLDSYAAAGATVAALMIGTTGSAPLRGRTVDRWGQFPFLLCLSLVQAMALGGFVAYALAGGGLPGLIVLAAAIGATSSTLGGSMRALWPTLIRSADDLRSAYALQALLEDLIIVIGPLLASLLLAVASPAAVLIASGAASLGGTAAFVTTSASRSAVGRQGRTTSFLGALSAPGMRMLVITLVSAGAVIGVLNVAVPAFAQGRGNAPAAGVLLTAMSAASVVSGLVYGARSWKARPGRHYVWLVGSFALLAAPLAVAESFTQLGGLLVLLGLSYAPRMTCAYLLLDDLAPAGTITEAYTWLVSAQAGGFALGAALAGPAVQHAGVHRTFALAAVGAAVGLVAAVVGRTALQPEPVQ